MEKRNEVVIIGAGKMGSAMAIQLVKRGVNVTLTAHSEEARARWLAHPTLSQANITIGNNAALEAEVVVLAVKPVNLSEIYAELGGKLLPSCLVISVVAGATVSALAKGLRHYRVVRTMPNLAAEYGEGVTVWYCRDLEKEYEAQVLEFLGQLGKEYRATDEDDLACATALFGCGPAFLYYFLEEIEKAGKRFPKDRLHELMVQMVRGTAVLAEQNPTAEFEHLRKAITSKGGATEEGVKVLEECGARGIMEKVIAATLNKVGHLLNGKGK